MLRRHVVGALLGAIGAAACGGARESVGPPKAAVPLALDLDPIVDLIPAAGLEWLISLRPPEILARPSLAELVGAIAENGWIDAFSRRHGIDVRQADELAVARYAGAAHSTLAVARLRVELARVESAFAARATAIEGRAIERGVTRFWGNVGGEREQVAVFGHEGVAMERGALGPLRAAVYFAQGRLKRAHLALHAEPLASATARLGDGPLRGFIPGPFEGNEGAGLGGLLGAATALAVSLQAPETGTSAEPPALSLRLVMTGAWGADASAAADHLAATFRDLGQEPFARLTGLDRPLARPTPTGAPDAISLDVRLDAVRMKAGIRAVTVAPAAEIMAF